MRLAILGGGGFRVPLIHRALMAEDSGVETVVLHDVDPARVSAIKAVLDESRRGVGRRSWSEDDLAKALTGTDFVFSAIRVGGLRGRTCDERSALAEGVLGQETTGAGGICYGLRTVPVALRIAEAVRRSRAVRMGHQLHQPGRHGDRGDESGAGRSCDRHLRLAGGSVPQGRSGLGYRHGGRLVRLRRA